MEQEWVRNISFIFSASLHTFIYMWKIKNWNIKTNSWNSRAWIIITEKHPNMSSRPVLSLPDTNLVCLVTNRRHWWTDWKQTPGGFQLKLQPAVFGMVNISFYCKYSAKSFYMFQYGYCRNALTIFCFHSVLNVPWTAVKTALQI